MPTASRNARKLRRVKIDRRLAYKMLDLAIAQRDQMRITSLSLQQELKKYTDGSKDAPSDTPPVYGDVAAQLEADKNLSPEAKGDYTSGV